MSLSLFHPAVAAWFRGRFDAPTVPQSLAWPAIKAGRHTLIAAPTGSGKTLAAFLAALDDLVRAGQEAPLDDACHVVYVSPLKALSNDVQHNLMEPLAGIDAELERMGLTPAPIRVLVRTGDTSQKDRAAMVARPPHIVVTTPESLYILLTSESGRRMLRTVRTAIVDEIHAVVDDRRGSHLALSLERLEALAGGDLVRVGLSATQKPIEEVARFLVGTKRVAADGVPECAIVDTGHARDLDLAIEVPGSPLSAVMSNEVWKEVYDRLAELAGEHRTTLVFVNTRRLAERVARHLGERIGAENVTSHHGSLSREHRLAAERRLKAGELRCLVATASLELGIDIGSVELVCQIGSPRSIAGALQRVGRSGHSLGGRPKGLLFPVSRDDLVECAALVDAVRRGELDRLAVPVHPLDILSQQIVAAAAAEDWTEDDLFALARRAWPYRDLEREDFDAVLRMLATGFTTRRGRSGAWLHHDGVGRKVRGRKGARLAAMTSGGAIPDTADYQVVLEPTGAQVGTVNEDFAIESSAGDIFQLGNSSWKIVRVEPGRVRVEDARGAPPTIPFWLGEAPGRTAELSFAVSRLREEVARRLDADVPGVPPLGTALEGPVRAGLDRAVAWLVNEAGVGRAPAEQIVDYLASAKGALGAIPTQTTIVLERFFDETGGMQLVIHSPFGSRLNRAWGLSLRKRFCRKFNFELQAAATEDAIVLSLGATHSFPLEDVPHYLTSKTVRDLLVQAVLDAPMFTARWRWNAGRALAVPRFRGGRKVPAPIQRFLAEDLLALVFPDQLACAENLTGEREIPDHPLVRQTILDCLEEAMDEPAFEELLLKIERGEVRVITRDLTEPSPLALEVVGARPYAFLDDAPLEERRTQAVAGRRWLDAETAADLGALDADAIARVREEASPQAETADELHDALLVSGYIPEAGAPREWTPLFEELAAGARAARLDRPACLDTPSSPSLSYVQPGERASDRTASPSDESQVPHRDDAASKGAIVPPDSAAEEDWTEATALVEVAAEPGSVNSRMLWIAAERLAQLRFLYPDAPLAPAIEPPPRAAEEEWTEATALVELVRARLEVLGPRTAAQLAGESGLPEGRIDEALAALEGEGFAMRGRFTPGATGIEWCSRRLLARIHRYTLDRLRREIEPVAASDFVRFLIAWQRVRPAADTASVLGAGSGSGSVSSVPGSGVAGPATAPEAEDERPAPIEAPGRRVDAPAAPHALGRASRGSAQGSARQSDAAEGPAALSAILDQLEGFEAPAVSWEEEILPARLAPYDPSWLDGLCLSGKLAWMRLRPPKPGPGEARGAAPVRSTPIGLLQRANLGVWTSLSVSGETRAPELTSIARAVRDRLATRGASFFEEIVRGTGLLRVQVEDALGELVARGLASSDGFAGLRALLTPQSRRPSALAVRRRRSSARFGMESAGRWALLPAASLAPDEDQGGPDLAGRRGLAAGPSPSRGPGSSGRQHADRTNGSPVQQDACCPEGVVSPLAGAARPSPPLRVSRRVVVAGRGRPAEQPLDAEAVEAVARILLRRYGVVFRRILDRESSLPPWRDLLRVYRRLEARGEIRGGRFVAGFSGEQYALPEAVGTLRAVRRRPVSGELVSVSAADPLNLTGIITPGERVPSAPANRVLLRDGVPIAVLEAGEVRFLIEVTDAQSWRLRTTLLRRGAPRPVGVISARLR